MIPRFFYSIAVVSLGLGFFLVSCSIAPSLFTRDHLLTANEHLSLGMVYEEQGKWNRAVSSYKMAFQKDQALVQALVNIGNVYTQRKQYEEAEEYYRKALEIDSKHPMANNNLAWVMILEGEPLDEAEVMILKAMVSDPDRLSVYYDTLALLYFRWGRFREAMGSIKKAEEHLSVGDRNLAERIADTRERIMRAARSNDHSPSPAPVVADPSEEAP